MHHMRQNERERVDTTATNRDDSPVGRLRDNPTTGSRYRRVVVLVLVVCGLAAVPVVSAHSYLVSSTPEDGAQLADAPETVTLRFSSSVKSANITVADLAGNRVDTGSVTRINDTSFRMPLGELGPGAYTVEWQIVSADGHQLDGSITFVVVSGETPPQATKTAAQPTTENGTTTAATTTPESTERSTRTATVTTTAGSATTTSATTRATNGQAQTTEGTGAGFGLAAAVVGGIGLVITLLLFRGWRE
jgi:methionine-rich copper-binding protein CopC